MDNSGSVNIQQLYQGIIINQGSNLVQGSALVELVAWMQKVDPSQGSALVNITTIDDNNGSRVNI